MYKHLKEKKKQKIFINKKLEYPHMYNPAKSQLCQTTVEHCEVEGSSTAGKRYFLLLTPSVL